MMDSLLCARPGFNPMNAIDQLLSDGRLDAENGLWVIPLDTFRALVSTVKRIDGAYVVLDATSAESENEANSQHFDDTFNDTSRDTLSAECNASGSESPRIHKNSTARKYKRLDDATIIAALEFIRTHADWSLEDVSLEIGLNQRTLRSRFARNSDFRQMVIQARTAGAPDRKRLSFSDAIESLGFHSE